MAKTYSKDELISFAQDVLNENRGWWSNDEPSDRERIKDINSTKQTLDNGKLADPYGVIEGAYNDYHEFITGADDSDFDNGHQGKVDALNELDTLIEAVE